MSRTCELTGKSGQYGNTVSNANNRHRTKNYVNLNSRSLYVPELGRTVRVRLSNRAIRTIDKVGGLIQACSRYEDFLSPKLAQLYRSARRRTSTKKKSSSNKTEKKAKA